MDKQRFAVTSIVLTLCACNGQIYHQPVDVSEADGAANLNTGKQPGIIYYPRAQMLKTTAVTKSDATTKACTTTATYDLVTVPDMAHPQRLWYEPAWLEAYKFSPTLSADGTLTSLSTESTPDQGNTFKNIASGISSLASAASSAATAAKTAVVDRSKPQAQPIKCTEGTAISLQRITDLSQIPALASK